MSLSSFLIPPPTYASYVFFIHSPTTYCSSPLPSQMALHHVHSFNELYPKVAWRKISNEIVKKVGDDKKNSFRSW